MKIHLQRGWWKPWNWSTRTWLFAIVASTIVSPIATRWYYLSQVPDVALPFDAEKFITCEVPSEQDAFTHYVSAGQMLERDDSEWWLQAVNDALRENESWDPRLDQWFIENSQILAELERGSICEDSSKSSLNSLSPDSSIHGCMRNLMRVSGTAAVRCSRSGNFEDAWRWHRVTLRLARHTEKRGAMIDWMVASAIRGCVLDLIRNWVSYESLTAEQIQNARKEFTQITSDRIALSEIMKSEYLYIKYVLETVPNYVCPELEKLSDLEYFVSLPPIVTRWYTWSSGQPELALRFSRQLLINNLDQIDQPLHLRRQVLRLRYPMVFTLDPRQERPVGQLSPAELENALEGSVGHRLVGIELFSRLGSRDGMNDGVDDAYQKNMATISMTDVVMAAHEFYRSHGDFPARLEELVPEFLDNLPFDPMNAGGMPLGYRRDERGQAIVWSVGLNGVDDGGDIEGKDPKDCGYRILLKTTAKSRSSEN